AKPSAGISVRCKKIPTTGPPIAPWRRFLPRPANPIAPLAIARWRRNSSGPQMKHRSNTDRNCEQMHWKTSVAVFAIVATARPIRSAGWGDPPAAVKPRPVEAPPAEASAQEIHTFCGHCHAYPPPESFPRFAWREEVRKAYDFFRDANLRLDTPDLERVV